MNALTNRIRNLSEPAFEPVVSSSSEAGVAGREIGPLARAGLTAAGALLLLWTPATADDALWGSTEFDTFSEMGSGLPEPEWAGNTGATQQYYRFLDNSLSGTADVFNNPFGTPDFTVVADAGQAAWLNPEGANSTVREDNGGVWEIENGDIITFSIPLPQGGNGGRSLNFLLNIVAFQGEAGFFDSFYSLPSFSVAGHTIDNLAGENNPLGEPGMNGEWVVLSWQGTVNDVTANEISFVVSNTADGTLALFDSFEAYVIPEPGTYVLLFGIAAALAVGIRRKISR